MNDSISSNGSVGASRQAIDNLLLASMDRSSRSISAFEARQFTANSASSSTTTQNSDRPSTQNMARRDELLDQPVTSTHGIDGTRPISVYERRELVANLASEPTDENSARRRYGAPTLIQTTQPITENGFTRSTFQLDQPVTANGGFTDPFVRGALVPRSQED